MKRSCAATFLVFVAGLCFAGQVSIVRTYEKRNDLVPGDGNIGAFAEFQNTFNYPVEVRYTYQFDKELKSDVVMIDAGQTKTVYLQSVFDPTISAFYTDGSGGKREVRDVKISKITPQGKSGDTKILPEIPFPKLLNLDLLPQPLELTFQVNLEAELAEAQKQWLKDERKKEDDFERIHKQMLVDWQLGIRLGTANYDDHPDVMMMKALTGQEGTLIAPSIAKEYDQLLIDRGWYPYAVKFDGRDGKTVSRYGAHSNGTIESIERNGDYAKDYRDSLGMAPEFKQRFHPDVPREIKMPRYNDVRGYFLKRKEDE